MSYDALIIIDMQTALLAEHPYQEEKVIANIQTITAACRKANVPVIYVRHDGGTGDSLEEGTDGWQIAASLLPQPEDYYVNKQFNSAFRHTNLQELLTSLNAKNIILCGMQTEYCFDVSCKVAFELGYHITIAKDTTTTFDNDFASAEDLSRYYEDKIWHARYATVVPVAQVLQTLTFHDEKTISTNRLATFEQFVQQIQTEQETITQQLEVLRVNGKERTVKFRELLAQKLTNTAILSKLSVYNLV